jgi:hypothetical protein
MNNFDIDDAVLQLLKNYLHQNLCFICIWQPYALSLIPDLQSVSGLVQVYQTLEEFQEAAAINYLKTHIVKDLYPCPLATCK